MFGQYGNRPFFAWPILLESPTFTCLFFKIHILPFQLVTNFMFFVRHLTPLLIKRISCHVKIAGLFVVFLMVLTLNGCGTMKWSDTSRTATEQLLLTHAMDSAVGKMNFSSLFNKTVFIDSTAIDPATDSKYFVSTIRQHLLASGAKVVGSKDDADYVVELRTGTVGTDRNDLMVGIPSFTVPTMGTQDFLTGGSAIPEIALYKKTDQRAVVKVAAFVYNKKTNSPLWQSGNILTESRIRARWIFGAGPFSKGDIYNGTELAGTKINPTITQIIDIEGDKGMAPSVTLPVFYKEIEEKEPDIPQPTLDMVPTAETKPDDPEKPQEMLAANDQADPGEKPGERIALAPQYVTGQDIPQNIKTPAQQSPQSIYQNTPVPPANGYPPVNGYVPQSTALPWQNSGQVASPQFAPGFGGYYR